jgi:predicted RNase H-like HicB family nuclease
MRFLADESCDFAMVRALRSSGHDVVAVSDIAPRAEDPDVINLALRESRILLTEDAEYKKLDNGTWYAEVPDFKGVWANAQTVEDCRRELISVLEEWLITDRRLTPGR